MVLLSVSVRIVASIIVAAVLSFIFHFDFTNDSEAIAGAWVVSTIIVFAIGSLLEGV